MITEASLKKLNKKQFAELEKELAAKLSKILDKAGKDANKLLNSYGLDVKIAYSLNKKQENPIKS